MHVLVLFTYSCIVIKYLKFSNIYTTRCNFTQFIYIWKLLYMFRVVPSPIIRGADKCIYSIWYLSHRYCYLPLSWKRTGVSVLWVAYATHSTLKHFHDSGIYLRCTDP